MLPETIADSIGLVRQLGERYLWVDVLCIVQDDPDDKAVQIHTMELIYGSSVFTIFAAGGKTASGTSSRHSYSTTIYGGDQRPSSHAVSHLPALSSTLRLLLPRDSLGLQSGRLKGWERSPCLLHPPLAYYSEDSPHHSPPYRITNTSMFLLAEPDPLLYHVYIDSLVHFSSM